MNLQEFRATRKDTSDLFSDLGMPDAMPQTMAGYIYAGNHFIIKPCANLPYFHFDGDFYSADLEMLEAELWMLIERKEGRSVPNYMIEFPDFDAHADVEALMARGFLDCAWHNDTCPRFESDDFMVFVDYDEEGKREIVDGNQDRFYLYVIDPNEDQIPCGEFRTVADLVLVA